MSMDGGAAWRSLVATWPNSMLNATLSFSEMLLIARPVRKASSASTSSAVALSRAAGSGVNVQSREGLIGAISPVGEVVVWGTKICCRCRLEARCADVARW